jgi:ATP phosphoribosyltransferase
LLNLTLPNGTFEPEVLKLFDEAGLSVVRGSSRSYNARIEDPRFRKVKFLRPQEIPNAIEKGYFDLGLCALHSIREARAQVVEVLDLGPAGRASGFPRIVLAVPSSSGITSANELPRGSRVATEFPEIARDYFRKKSIDVQVLYSHGATEGKIPELADAIVELTETGATLREAGLNILDTLSLCSLKVIANNTAWADETKGAAIADVSLLLGSVYYARGSVMLQIIIPTASLKAVIAALPKRLHPFVVQSSNDDRLCVSVVVPRVLSALLIPEFRRNGARDIVEVTISKFVTEEPVSLCDGEAGTTNA